MRMMPNITEDTPNYQHIKALVRDLHMTRNVARPDHLIGSSANNNNINNNTNSIIHSATSTSCKSVSIAQKLIVHQLSSMNGPRKATIEDSQIFIEDDYEDVSDTNTSSLDLSISLPSVNKRARGTYDVNFSIPSVVITDINEPLDLITSTQRRFSQLYSGLRRLSTSHTVGIPKSKNCTDQLIKSDLNTAHSIHFTEHIALCVCVCLVTDQMYIEHFSNF